MLRFAHCNCKATYSRIPRSIWMRVFLGRHLYRCDECAARMLLPTSAVATAHKPTL
ncbi:MAG: hypothetical protein K0R58_222 [Ramlibacter sp.]|jgi:predicted SprT family Zn-dependent metalloprotease|nr:hypothetical protein [Ramlibacter sp.]